MERALENSERMYRMLTQVAPVGIFHADAQGRCTFVNRQWCELTGSRLEEALGRSWLETVHPQDKERVQQECSLAVLRRRTFDAEFRYLHPDGKVVWVMARVQHQHQHQNSEGYVGTVTDITERKLSESEIRWLAFYDPLTSLPNRRLLLDRLQQALAASARSARHGALMYVDLDLFKQLNDTHGHEKGDLLLQQVAQRLQTCVREGDTVARLGGDEFVVVLEGLDAQAAVAAQQARAVGEKILAASRPPYLLGELEYSCTLSIGATLFKGHAHPVDALMQAADRAMYQAKAGGRSALRLHEPTLPAPVTS
jgi:diguanylate cyclase (GGDEF)-like protein/PAS domain S-box-containing protein